MYIADCLNHAAKQSLDWQVPQSLQSSNTVDITVFRFYFWQPIEYFSPKIKYPSCKWQKSRFVGIAWGHCDLFTYRIWTELDVFGDLTITAFVDSEHTHDKLTWRSISGLIIFVDRKPVFYQAKRQGPIETSTYGTEFLAMKTAVEEVSVVRYMVRSLGIHITKP